VKLHNNSTLKSAFSHGYSLIELITVLSVLALLISIANTALQNIFKDLDNDELQAHLNNAGSECLRAIRSLKTPERYQTTKNLALDNDRNLPETDKNVDLPFLIDAIDDDLLEKIGYKINSTYKNCMYFQVEPIDSSSSTKPILGFGIYNNRLFKFGIAKQDSANKDARYACERWAGENCASGKTTSYNKFFLWMNNRTYFRDKCEKEFQAKITESSEVKFWDRWDASNDNICDIQSPVKNTNSNYRTKCKHSLCNKRAYIVDGKFVGYNEADYNQATALECSNSISSYINSSSYNGAAEEKTTGLAGCTGTKYICDYKEHTEESYKLCKIESAVSECKKDLEDKRKAKVENGFIDVAGTGLSPCGRRYWVCNGAVYETKQSYKDAGCT